MEIHSAHQAEVPFKSKHSLIICHEFVQTTHVKMDSNMPTQRHVLHFETEQKRVEEEIQSVKIGCL